jgi:hypothetical protein
MWGQPPRLSMASAARLACVARECVTRECVAREIVWTQATRPRNSGGPDRHPMSRMRLSRMRPRDTMREVAIAFLILATLSATEMCGQSADASEGTAPQAEVLVSGAKRSRVGERPTLTIQIKNVGKRPFYITRAIEAFDYHGGFQVVVTPPAGARMVHGVAAGDYFGRVDILKEAQDFILLVPNAMYGGTITSLDQLLSPGTYRISVRRVPLLISDGMKEKLRTGLKFPVLLNTVEGAPISWKVSK